MGFYELIYETGAHSIANYANDTEALEAVSEQHRRATSGELGGPSGHSAERVVKVLKYDEHPATLLESQVVDGKQLLLDLSKAISVLSVGNLVSVPEVTSALQELTNPMVVSAPHDSNYKMKEKGELEATWL